MEQIDRERFGSFLCELRKEKNFTQRELAERLFVSNKAVSKWERGQSLPDISLLTPLAQLLDVSVAELLKGARLSEDALDSCEAKELVEKAVHLSAQEQEKRGRARRFWKRAWVVSAALAALETTALITLNQLTAVELWDYLLLVEGLMLGFGFYFCFFVKETLPTYYDENKISVYSDGPFRMSLPGVRFNNSNWPHVIRVGRVWMLGTAALWPPIFWLARRALPDGAMLAITLAFALGFFLPMMIAAKKYE